MVTYHRPDGAEVSHNYIEWNTQRVMKLQFSLQNQMIEKTANKVFSVCQLTFLSLDYTGPKLNVQSLIFKDYKTLPFKN